MPPEKVGDYLRELRGLFDKYRLQSLDLRPFRPGVHPLPHRFRSLHRGRDPKVGGRSWMRRPIWWWLAGPFRGSMATVRHGPNYCRKMFGEELVQAFREFKAIWDPEWKMNPGKVVDPYPMTSNLRLGPDYKPPQPETHFQFPDDQAQFARAALRCVGVGNCRRSTAAR